MSLVLGTRVVDTLGFTQSTMTFSVNKIEKVNRFSCKHLIKTHSYFIYGKLFALKLFCEARNFCP